MPDALRAQVVSRQVAQLVANQRYQLTKGILVAQLHLGKQASYFPRGLWHLVLPVGFLF